MGKNIFFVNPDKSGQVVRKIVAQAIICMLLLTVVSCEKTDPPFEYEEPEITEVFTSRFHIDNNVGRFFMFDQLSPGLVIDPVNLPERFQRDAFVQATVGRIGEDANEFGYPRVKIMDIQETGLRDGTYSVSTNDRGEFVLGEIGLSSSGHIQARPPDIPL